ncbi:MAG: cytochrome c [Cytophagales bacterium]|nr:MAG: cytochrome c [Cytophagales bacterium]TAF60780.1 MAG: cytochrome c [Cytophagales bacterium]
MVVYMRCFFYFDQLQRILLLCFCLGLVSACTHNSKEPRNTVEYEDLTDNHELASGQNGLSFVLTELQEKNQLPSYQKLTIKKDPLYGKKKIFKGFYLRQLLDSMVDYKKFQPLQSQVMFICSDGYTSSIELTEVLNKNPFVVVQDLSSPDGGKWEKIKQQNGKMVSPEPFYMVWEQESATDVRKYPWPYNLVTIDIIPNQLAYGKAYPKDSKLYGDGFYLFKRNCMSCHNIHNVGGSLGPSLTSPRHVTDYWKHDELLAFIKDPTTFRPNAKMPSSRHLTDKDLKEIIKYLEHIKIQK